MGASESMGIEMTFLKYEIDSKTGWLIPLITKIDLM
jgi:hypothetical protein